MCDFSSKSRHNWHYVLFYVCCLRYCKCTSFKQITTEVLPKMDFGHHCRLTENGDAHGLLHLLWGAGGDVGFLLGIHCFFLIKCLVSWFYFVSLHKPIWVSMCYGTLPRGRTLVLPLLFIACVESSIFIELCAILQKYDFSSKPQLAITAALQGMAVRMVFSICCGALAMCRLFV